MQCQALIIDGIFNQQCKNTATETIIVLNFKVHCCSSCYRNHIKSQKDETWYEVKIREQNDEIEELRDKLKEIKKAG